MLAKPPSQSIGVDIEDISRFSQKPYQDNIGFYQKIFSKQEIEYCLSKKNPYPHFAARFCAKEAFMKATGFIDVEYPTIEVVKLEERPYISYNEHLYSVSLSHEQEKAIAVVIV